MNQVGQQSGVNQLKMLMLRRVKGAAGLCIKQWRSKTIKAKFEDTVNQFEDRLSQASSQNVDAGIKQLKMMVVRRVKGLLGTCIVSWRQKSSRAKFEDTMNMFEDRISQTGQEAGIKRLKMMVVRRVKGTAGSCIMHWKQKAAQAKYDDMFYALEDKMNTAGQEAGVKQLQMMMVRRVRGDAGTGIVTWRRKALNAKYEDTVNQFEDRINTSGQEAGVKRLKMIVVRRVRGDLGSCLMLWRQKAGAAKVEDTMNMFEDRINQTGQEAGIKRLKMMVVRRVKGTAGSCIMHWKQKAAQARYEDTMNKFEDRMSNTAENSGIKRLKMMVVRRVKGAVGSCLATWRENLADEKLDLIQDQLLNQRLAVASG